MRCGNDGFGRWTRNLGHCAKDRADMFVNPDRVSVGVRVTPFQRVGQSLHGDSGLVVRLLEALEGTLRTKHQRYDEQDDRQRILANEYRDETAKSCDSKELDMESRGVDTPHF